MLDRLERELAPDLAYHGVHHTRDDVLPAVERLAELSGLGGEELLLLRTAALFHDVGFLEQYFRNEEIAGDMAAATLPNYGYSAAQIEEIKRIIMATQLPQSPHNFLAQLMCDADLDSLGRQDFMVTSINLWQELEAYGISLTDLEWYQRQLEFLGSHTYFSDQAKTLRDAGKQKNLVLLRERLASLS